jgi:hypothetical protein
MATVKVATSEHGYKCSRPESSRIINKRAGHHMAILEAIEASAFSTWVRESPSIFAYTFILTLHAIGLAFLAGLHSVISLRLLGRWKAIPLAPLEKFYPTMYVALWVNIVSGAALLAAALIEKMTQPIFYFKLAFIAIGVTVLMRMRTRVFGDTAAMAAGTVSTEGRTLAWISLVAWLCAIITGRLSEYPDLVNGLFGI